KHTPLVRGIFSRGNALPAFHKFAGCLASLRAVAGCKESTRSSFLPDGNCRGSFSRISCSRYSTFSGPGSFGVCALGANKSLQFRSAAKTGRGRALAGGGARFLLLECAVTPDRHRPARPNHGRGP